ncbi:GGDEF domain-containing protein [Sphingomonas cavernae]|uniref:Diguanylate cyclase n=1 Tax=Sphingomonas cavernae TaxID=2320861 RepID=A0A418W7H2_9SPHN|nr:diguanylate cyclase [Sphingomonas cavernae]RJF85814.1 diguanylate cyclase [Sphingomonas cavernae]
MGHPFHLEHATIGHGAKLSSSWQLSHTWPIPALIQTADALPDAAPFAPVADFEQMRSIAGFGAWECDLRDNGLRWTGEVFDLFGLPKEARVHRAEAVAIYDDESREAMELLRAYAIKHRRGFTVDVRLVRPDGQHRWMRLTTSLACEGGRPSRLYGTKQDVTFERARRETLKGTSGTDQLTGLATHTALEARLSQAATSEHQSPGALLVIDVEHIATIRRELGDAAGDACLDTIASRLAHDREDILVVARIDDYRFAVLMGVSSGPRTVEQACRQLVREISRPIYWQGYLLRVAPLVGMARAPESVAFEAELLVSVAVARAEAAKRRGRGIDKKPRTLSLIP